MRAFRTELDPNQTQRGLIVSHAGAARWAYNWGLRKHQEAYQRWVSEGKPKKWEGWPNAATLHKELNLLKKSEIPWMYEVSKCAPQEALRNLDRAFKNFLQGKAKYPRFKSKKDGLGSFRLYGAVGATERAAKLPRIGEVRTKERGYLPTSGVVSATVSHRAGRWFVSFLVDQEPKSEAPKPHHVIGVDVGIKHLAVTSDGDFFENPKALQSKERLLRIRQKAVSRKVKGSNNRRKAAEKVAQLHYRISNIRRDSIHKMTTSIAKKTSVIVIEDLNVAGMLRNHKLARAISDASFHEVHRQLGYKVKWYGAQLLKAPMFFPSSKRCSRCGAVRASLALNERVFQCHTCGFEIDRDLNSGLNLKDLAPSLGVSAYCPGSSGPRGTLGETSGWVGTGLEVDQRRTEPCKLSASMYTTSTENGENNTYTPREGDPVKVLQVTHRAGPGGGYVTAHLAVPVGCKAQHSQEHSENP